MQEKPDSWSPGNLCSGNVESWALESGIQLKELRIPLTTGIQNPSLSWIPLHGAIYFKYNSKTRALGVVLHFRFFFSALQSAAQVLGFQLQDVVLSNYVLHLYFSSKRSQSSFQLGRKYFI